MKISVITVAYNSEATISDTLRTVEMQTHQNFEHLVIDGKSKDTTAEIVRAHTRPGLFFISELDNGIYEAMNKGILLATGDVVGFLHSDDLFASNEVLSKVARAFEDPDVCAVYGDLEYVSQYDTRIVIRKWKSKPFNRHDLSWGWMPAHPTLYVRREFYTRIGGFNTGYKISADYLSILQLFTQPNFKSIYIPEVLVTMRLGGASNKSFQAVMCKTKEDWQALRNCDFSGIRAVCAIAWKNLSKVGQFFTHKSR